MVRNMLGASQTGAVGTTQTQIVVVVSTIAHFKQISLPLILRTKMLLILAIHNARCPDLLREEMLFYAELQRILNGSTTQPQSGTPIQTGCCLKLLLTMKTALIIQTVLVLDMAFSK